VVLLPEWQRQLRPQEAVTKLGLTVRVLEAAVPAERPSFTRLLSEPHFNIGYAAGDRALTPLSNTDRGNAELGQQLASRLGKPVTDVRVHFAVGATAPELKRVEVLLKGGGVATIVAPIGPENRLGFVEQAAIAAFFLFVLAGLWAWLSWMVNAPLTRFAQAAERVGLDVHAPAFPEQGPAEVRRVIRAFNQMQVRLQRMITDRTLMLGAISHDLRTPLTRLRLRIETDRVADDKPKMLSDIESMESMLTSTLSFVRGVEETEAAEDVDLDLMLQTVCDLITDVGGEVVYEGPGRCRYLCKPQSMMRALTNVVANASKYGSRAEVRLARQPQSGYRVEVEDHGPGIPADEKPKVFEPFYRTAAARDRDSQGMGLGLSIARSVVLSHGGAIELADARPQGLIVRITLPAASV
jgi:signal transduction histidine kinase